MPEPLRSPWPRSPWPRSPWLVKLAEPVLIFAGFAASRVTYRILFPENYARLTTGELAGGFLVSVVTFWAAVRLCERTGEEESWALLFQQFCVGTGFNLVVQAVFNYFQLLTRSFFLILVGGMLAALFLGIARLWIYPRIYPRAAPIFPNGVLIVGSDPIANRLARSLGQPILGAIGSPYSGVVAGAASGIPVLGEFYQFDEIVSQRRPTHILMASHDWASSISPSALWRLRLRGITVSDIPGLYEKLFQRVYCRGLYPAEMLLSPALSADSRTMAIQAIYTNLIGLFFLIALSPVLAVTTLAVALFSGPGPILESVECSGFQKISFRLLRFRTLKTDGSGAPSRLERIISRLHLVNLPRLINIVRGEMALFGPRPVRREFARRLTEMMPFYSIRFSVKPGILGWSQAHLDPAVDELREIEYDIYYIKQASPLLDLEILIRMLAGRKRSELPAAELARSTR
jgi:lipopolysaccharide/colanic/teichoic acid biosynthesis glycosyltransferase